MKPSNQKPQFTINLLSSTKQPKQSDFRVHFTLMNVQTHGLSDSNLVESIGRKINQQCKVSIAQVANIVDDKHVDISVGLFNDREALHFLKQKKDIKLIDFNGNEKSTSILISRAFTSYMKKYLPTIEDKKKRDSQKDKQIFSKVQPQEPKMKIEEIKEIRQIKEKPEVNESEKIEKLYDRLWLFGIPTQFTKEDLIKVFQSREICILDSHWIVEDSMEFLQVYLEKQLPEEYIQRLALKIQGFPFITIPCLGQYTNLLSYLSKYQVQFAADKITQETVINYADGIGGVNILLRNDYNNDVYYTIVFNSQNSVEKVKKGISKDLKYCQLHQQKSPVRIGRLRKFYTFENLFLSMAKEQQT